MPARPSTRRTSASRSCISSTSRAASSARSTTGSRNRTLPLVDEEADLAARLEDGPANLAQRVDLLDARLGLDLGERDPLALEVALDGLAVAHDHDRLAVEHGSQTREAEAEP